MNRSDLMEQLGMSVNQASADLNRYIGLAPDNMVYDKRARTYVRGPDYAAQFLKPDASRYLEQLRSVADGIMDNDDAWIAELPSYDSAPTPTRGVNQKKVIAHDDGIYGGRAQIKVRRALLCYALKRLGLDTAPSARIPHEQQIILINRDIVIGEHRVGQV